MLLVLHRLLEADRDVTATEHCGFGVTWELDRELFSLDLGHLVAAQVLHHLLGSTKHVLAAEVIEDRLHELEVLASQDALLDLLL